MSILKENSILKLANSILEVLGQDIVLEDEDYLYNDEFYVTIVSNVVPDNTCNIEVGETEDQKIESLSTLVNFLSSIVEMDLSHINARGIIEDRDEESVRQLLELILELIIILKQEQEGGEQGEEEADAELGEDLEEEDLENQLERADNSHSENRYSKLNNQSINFDNTDKENDIDDGRTSNPTVRINKQGEDSNNYEDSLNFNLRDNKSCPTAEILENTSGLNYKENYSQNDLTRYEKVISYLANNEELLQEEELRQDEEEVSQNLVHENELNNMNFYQEEDDSKPAVNISRISEVSRSKENSEPHSNQKYLKNTYTLTNQRNDESALNKITHSQEKGTGRNESRTKERHNNKNNIDSVEFSMDVTDKSNLKDNSIFIEDRIKEKKSERGVAKNSSQDVKYANPKGSNRSKNTINSKNTKNAESSSTRTKKQSKMKYLLLDSQSAQDKIEKYESSHIEEGGEVRTLKKTKSQKKLINKSQSDKASKYDISMSSLNVSKRKLDNSKSNLSNSKYSRFSNNSRNDNTDNLIEELPLSDDNLKYEVMKEFRRIYGDKLDKVFVKNNMKNSNNTLEAILRNIKVAKHKMIKLGVSNEEPDDLITKEFMLKYSKELEYIINYYQSEERKRNFLKMKAVKNMSKNVNVMYRLQEIQSKNIENEIERRRKSRDLKTKNNQIKLCNEIYSKALELEKQKYLEERSNQAEIRKNENLEKRNIMVQIENYYKDKISILKEILRREKYEKEVEHRAKIQFLSKFEREKKAAFKKHIDEIFDRFDEEDRKYEFQNSQTGQLENVLTNYYRK